MSFRLIQMCKSITVTFFLIVLIEERTCGSIQPPGKTKSTDPTSPIRAFPVENISTISAGVPSVALFQTTIYKFD